MITQSHFSPKIIGPGKPGFKTRDLMKFADSVEKLDIASDGKKLNLSLPKSAVITPALCRMFEKQAGCGEKDDPKTAKEKMMNCKSGEFDGAIGEIYSFNYQKYMNLYIAIRSDDFGATGVLSSSFAHVNTNRPDSVSINTLKESAINVLASAYSEDAKEMAHLFEKFGSEGTGILANPFYGKETKMTFSAATLGPAYSVSYLAPIAKYGYYAWQVIRGIAATQEHGRKRVYASRYGVPLKDLLGTAQYDYCVGLGSGSDLPKPVNFMPMSKKIEPKTLENVGLALYLAMKELQSGMRLYAELVCEDSRKIYDWVVLQISGLESAKFSKPALINPEEEWVQTRRVMGFSDKNIQGVHFAKHEPDCNTRAYNLEHKDYLLVIESFSLQDFEKNWRISDYGNAGAIVFVIGHMLNPVISHLGGRLRMLDIPLLVLDEDMDSKSIGQLRALDGNSKIRVFADESIPIGWIKPQ